MRSNKHCQLEQASTKLFKRYVSLRFREITHHRTINYLVFIVKATANTTFTMIENLQFTLFSIKETNKSIASCSD